MAFWVINSDIFIAILKIVSGYKQEVQQPLLYATLKVARFFSPRFWGKPTPSLERSPPFPLLIAVWASHYSKQGVYIYHVWGIMLSHSLVTVIGTGMTITQTGGNLMCPQHKDVYQREDLRHWIWEIAWQGWVGSRWERGSWRMMWRQQYHLKTPNLILYWNNPVMIANLFLLLFMYLCVFVCIRTLYMLNSIYVFVCCEKLENQWHFDNNEKYIQASLKAKIF